MTIKTHKIGSAKDAEFARIDLRHLPRHIAIIMDGNGRWARARHLPRVAGHKKGMDAVRATVETAARAGIQWLTLYAFSVENWKRRPKTEVSFLMALLKTYLDLEVENLHRQNIRLAYIGRRHELPEDVQKKMQWAEDLLGKNTGMTLTLALNYGSRSEIADAFTRILDAAAKNGGIEHLRKAGIGEEEIGRHLYTSHQPDPDLVIRTSGEMRLSNFLLWQVAYSEIYVTETLWPDFRGKNLIEAIADFQKRERRYGGLTPAATASR